MDLTKELNEVQKFKNTNPKYLVDSVLEYNDNMQKKMHILYIMSISNTISELAKQKIFEKDDVRYLEIIPSDECSLYDSTNCYIMENNNSYNLLNKLLKNNFLNIGYAEKNNNRIDLTKDIKAQICKLFLTKELKTILDYNEINIELNEREKNVKQTKLKV